MSIMDGAGSGDAADSAASGDADPEGTVRKTFGTKPYLDKEGREILNRAGREIQRNHPDWVDDPEDPSASDCLVHLQERNSGFSDVGLMCELLGRGLTAEEVVVWILWQHSDLDPVEIFYAHEGKQTAGRAGVDDQAMRNIRSRIRSAAMKLGVDAELPEPEPA